MELPLPMQIQNCFSLETFFAENIRRRSSYVEAFHIRAYKSAHRKSRVIGWCSISTARERVNGDHKETNTSLAEW